jgi:hypothetical protein
MQIGVGCVVLKGNAPHPTIKTKIGNTKTGQSPIDAPAIERFLGGYPGLVRFAAQKRTLRYSKMSIGLK